MPDRAARHRSRLLDPAYHAAFESERARVLRRRITLLLCIILFLLGLSALGTYFEHAEYTDGEKTPLEVLVLGILQDVALTAVALATLIYVLQLRPDRRHLVRAITISTIITTAAAVYFDIRRAMLHPTDWLGDPVAGADPIEWGCRYGLLAYGLLVWLPLMVVPMRLREARWIVLGCWFAYTLLLILVAGPATPMLLRFAGLAVLVALPPVVFSHWRYTLFDAAFEHKELIGRYGEMSAELVNARKLHEAILPPPVTAGPVRIRFAYEPMREIGGDFLFVHGAPEPLESRSPAFPPAPLYVVLIDVSGHGVASALAVNRLHGELVRCFAMAADAASPDGLSAAELIDTLNSYVYLTLSPQGVFATAICLKVVVAPPADDGRSRITVEWANAGHPPAVLRRAGSPGAPEAPAAEPAIERLGPTATMLGVIEPREFEVRAHRIDLFPGDRLVAYTDGLMETRGAEGEEFGVERIETAVRGRSSTTDAPTPSAATPSAATPSAATPSAATPSSADAPPADTPNAETTLADALLQAARLFRAAGRVTDDTLVVEVAVPEMQVAAPPAPSASDDAPLAQHPSLPAST